MTSIAELLLVGDGRGDGLIRRPGQRQLSGGQDLFDRRDDSVQNPALPERITARDPYVSFRIVWLVRGDAEGDPNHRVELEDDSDSVSEGLGLTRVNEANRRRVAGREDRRLRHSVEAGCRRAEASIRD